MNPNEKGVIFESESSIAPVIIRPSKPTSGMARMVMRITGGLASNETQANYVLIGFVVVALVVTVFIFLSGSLNSVQDESRVLIDKAIGVTNAPR